MRHLVSIEELKSLGRPIGKNVDTEKLDAFRTEAEQLHVKPVLGDSLFGQLLAYVDTEGNDDEMETLLRGGSYTSRCGEGRCFMGLRYAISYFVYAQNLMSGDLESTRFGTRFKDDDYSTRLSSKERSDAYNNALEVGNAYLQESVIYAKEVGLIKNVGKRRYAVGGMTIRRIG